MTGEILKNNEKFVRKENTKKEGGKTKRPYNRKKKEFNNDEKEVKMTQEKNAVEVKREEGREEGRQEGRQNKATEIALNLLNMDMSFSVISQATGLSEKEIQQLKNSL